MLKDAGKFIDFVKQVFNAEITHHSMRDEKRLGHCEMQIDGSTIMFSDVSEDWDPQTANLFIYVRDADETFKKALEHKATVVMELADQDYGRSGGVMDPFGNIWWITSAPIKRGYE